MVVEEERVGVVVVEEVLLRASDEVEVVREREVEALGVEG